MQSDIILPAAVAIDGLTGGMSVETGRYVKRLSALRELFQDTEAADRRILEDADPVVYEVIEYKKDGSDLFFGTTTMFPGEISGEYFMTRGHFHNRRDMGEIYYTQSGEGLLLLETRDGLTRVMTMRSGVCCHIPPNWAHRSINTGSENLVFVWVCNIAAGNDYAEIATTGMHVLAVEQDGAVSIVNNPRFSDPTLPNGR